MSYSFPTLHLHQDWMKWVKIPPDLAHHRKTSSYIGGGGGDGQGHGEKGREHAHGCCQPAKSLDFHTGLETSEPLVRTIPIPNRSIMSRHSLYHRVGAGGQTLTSGMYLWILSCILSLCLLYLYIVIFISLALHTFIDMGILNGDKWWPFVWILQGLNVHRAEDREGQLVMRW